MGSAVPALATWIDDLRLRPFVASDAAPLARLADDLSLWRQVLDGMPQPYTLADARRYIAGQGRRPGRWDWALEWRGALAGALQLEAGSGSRAVQAEIGYWVGAPMRGRGLAPAAIDAASRWALGPMGLSLVLARPFARNRSSRVALERAGYRLLGVLPRAVRKDGELLDECLYVRMADRNDPLPAAG